MFSFSSCFCCCYSCCCCCGWQCTVSLIVVVIIVYMVHKCNVSSVCYFSSVLLFSLLNLRRRLFGCCCCCKLKFDASVSLFWQFSSSKADSLSALQLQSHCALWEREGEQKQRCQPTRPANASEMTPQHKKLLPKAESLLLTLLLLPLLLLLLLLLLRGMPMSLPAGDAVGLLLHSGCCQCCWLRCLLFVRSARNLRALLSLRLL